MVEPDAEGMDDAPIARLRVIEQQPLAERAPSYAALHDELVRALEAPAPRRDAP